MLALAEVETAILISIYKPILLTGLLGGWAWVGSNVDKDSAHFHLKRREWNMAHIGVAALACSLLLFIPRFWVGFPLAALLMAGSFGAYAYHRNQHVADDEKWRLSLDSFRAKWAEAEEKQKQKAATVSLLSMQGVRFDVPVGDDPRAAAHERLQSIIEFALPRGGDRVDIVVDPTRSKTIIQIDGVKYPLDDPGAAATVALIDYVKGAAQLDTQERRKLQAGKVQFDAGAQGRHAMAVSTQGTTQEMTMTLRIDPEARGLLPWDQLGLLKIQTLGLQPVLAEASRVVIATSPPGQGQTTTLYNMLRGHDPYTQTVIAFQTKSAFELEGVNFKEYDYAASADEQSRRLASEFRRDPNVIMLEKVEDGKLAQVVAEAGAEFRIYLGMRHEDTFSALRAWIKTVGNPQLAAQNLGAVVASRLVRKLCNVCRIPFQPDPEALRKLNLSPDKVGTMFKHSGQVMVKEKLVPCPACAGIGYRGRTGVYEVMVFDDEARAILAQGQLEALRAHLRKSKMLLLQEAALARVVDGVTSIQEITRALSKDADKPIPIPAAALPRPVPAA